MLRYKGYQFKMDTYGFEVLNDKGKWIFCNNALDTIDKIIESKIAEERRPITDYLLLVIGNRNLKDVSKAANISVTTLKNILHGKSFYPTITTIHRLTLPEAKPQNGTNFWGFLKACNYERTWCNCVKGPWGHTYELPKEFWV